MKEEQREVELEVERINQKTETSIVIAGTIWSEQLQEELSRWWTVLKGKLVAENNTTSKVEIRECIDRRCEMIKDNQRRMINSLLEKPFKKVVIDRLLIDNEGDRELYNEPEEVLIRTAEHFKRQFKKRNFQQEGISNEWKKVYEPITRVKESYYQSLSDRVTEKE